MKRFTCFLIMAVTILTACTRFEYESFPDDPTQTRIYTLDNGLKVYMSVNHDKPRIQTVISVRVGAQDDPDETTGLAHYFEHLMFKGTSRLGTSDYKREKPLLDSIETMFERYRLLTDECERTALYARIDSISQEAAKLAIPNEYDKLMEVIGSSGSNAWTSEDCTSYVEQIPSNQLENWARIQADRFRDPVIRGFHTELETVYEEYNMYLTYPMDRVFRKLYAMLFPDHAYGKHPVIGLQDHIKNPSITNIRNYFATYYVPNNMAICMSGEFDPDKAIRVINRYFSALKPNENLPVRQAYVPVPRTSPVVDECRTEDSECVTIAWNAPAAAAEDGCTGHVVASILGNGYCGLIDKDLVLGQKLLVAESWYSPMASAGYMTLYGEPKEGQTLDDVRNLLLGEVEKLRNGDFDESVITSVISNMRLHEMRAFESSTSMAFAMVDAFGKGMEWIDEVCEVDRMSRITKKDVMEWASKYLTADGHCTVYKRQGADTESRKITKPAITPLPTNADTESPYFASFRKARVEPIEPSFLDFDKDVTIGHTADGNEILYRHNDVNGTFELTYVYFLGLNQHPELDMAARYMELSNTFYHTRSQIDEELYSIACSYDFRPTRNYTMLQISGLADNTRRAIEITDEVMNTVRGNADRLAELKRDLMRERKNSLKDMESLRSALQEYCTYGREAVERMNISDARLRQMSNNELIRLIRSFKDLGHTIMYYGPMSLEELTWMLDNYREHGEHPARLEYAPLHPVQTDDATVTIAHYDSKQVRYTQRSVRNSDTFSMEAIPQAMMFNEYFSPVVYQQMREARALAYTASARYIEGEAPDIPYTFTAWIGTQNDKMRQAVEAFDSIIGEMPESDIQFESARKSLMSWFTSNRTIKSSVLWSFLNARLMGLDTDRNRIAYDVIRNMTFEDLKKFHREHISGRKYSYEIVGNTADIDMEYLKTLGPVTVVPARELFGY